MKKSVAGKTLALSIAVMWLLLTGAHAALAKGELGTKEARRLISKIGGGSLPSSDVHILAIQMQDGTRAIAQAQIETAFRFERDDDERWRVAEVRIGSDRWEDLELIASVLGRGAGASLPAFGEAGALAGMRPASELDAARARLLLAGLLGVESASESVRVREVSSLYKSAVVVARVAAEFRFSRDAGKWRLSGMRTGSGAWRELEETLRAVNQEKLRRAEKELEAIRSALQVFRRERGFYVVADDAATLSDQLNPRYLGRVIRLDPWHKPYLYQGTRDQFTLRSAGADGLPDTADDISLTSSSR